MKNYDLKTPKARADLKPRRNPYFMIAEEGRALGFRRGPDTWIARHLDASGNYHFKSLQGATDFTSAKQAADAWFDSLGGAFRKVRRSTVEKALLAYVENLRESGRPEAADTALGKLKTCILGNPDSKRSSKAPRHPLADKDLESCKREDFTGWRKSLVKRGISNQTVNRYVTCVTAGLNAAVSDLGHSGTAEAWTFADLPTDQADGETAVYLSTEQRERLSEHLSPVLRLFTGIMYATGGRTDEIARAKVGDYDPKHYTLKLKWRKGRPAVWKSRLVILDPAHRSLFAQAVKDKLPSAPLTPDEDGSHLTRHDWAKGIREAIAYANSHAKKIDALIPEDATAYSFRHTRISELLQVYGVDALTVAKQTGTSLAMMQKYYWKFLPDSIRDKFAAVNSRA